MRANFVVLSALTATALLSAAAASAAVLTVAPGTPTFSGVSADGAPYLAPSTTVATLVGVSYDSTSTTKIEKEVQTAPTTTTSGLAFVYEVTSLNQTRTDTMGSRDEFYWYQGLTGNGSGNEYLTFSGTLTATEAMSATLGVSGSGSYTALPSPFGTSVPALPSYYFRLGGTGAWTLLGSYSVTNADTGSFYGGASTAFTLSAGPTTFEVTVYAGSNVDLSNVGLDVMSKIYDLHDITTDLGTTTSRTLIGAELLASVPEPETYALILAGLLFVVLRLRSQRQ